MNLKDIVKWNVRVSLIYAVGIWTMLGTYGYFQLEMKWKKKEQTDDPANDALAKDLNDDSLAEPKPKEEKVNGLQVKSTIAYRENFVPYSARIYSYLQSFSSSTAEAATSSSSDDEK